MGNGQGNLSRAVADAGRQPLNPAAAIHQILDVRLKMLLRFDQNVMGAGEKINGFPGPTSAVGAHINDVLGIESAPFEQGKEMMPTAREPNCLQPGKSRLANKLVSKFPEDGLYESLQAVAFRPTDLPAK